MTATDDDEMTELVDADFPRVDLVGKGANGIPRFLIAKQDEATAGLLDPEFVRELIGKQASGREQAVLPNGITVTGSPAAMAAFIHKASVRQATSGIEDGITKAKLSSAELNDLPDSAFAYIEPGGKKDEHGKTTPRSLRHFAIHDAAHVRDALGRAPQSPFGDKAMPKIRSAAKKFGIEVSKETGVTAATVTKDAMGETDTGIDGLDPTVALGPDPDSDYPGSVTDPGSPAWEALDASTAQKWLSIAARLRNALGVLSEREMLEAASADPDDCENAWDLEDAQCAMDYVIGILAVFAAGEQAEADLCGEAMASIGKAFGGFDPATLDTVEGLSAITKSGRVLSAANEAHIREAAAALNTVLSSLPKAPQASDDGQPVAKEKGTPVSETPAETSDDSAQVAKETATAETQAADASPVDAGGINAMGTPKGGPSEALPGDVPGREVLKSALTLVFDRTRTLVGVADSAAIVTRVAKADGDGEKKAMQAVFDQDGNLIGIVDPDAIQPVTGAGGKPGSTDDTEAAPAADDSDLTPQPLAEAGTPAGAVPDDDVAKQDADVHAVLKSIIADAVSEVLGAQAPQEDVAKQADVAGLAQKVEDMLARIAKVEEQPAAPKVFTSGQVPPAHQMRGQDQGAQPVDVAKAAELRRQFRDADPVEQNRLANVMQQAAIGHLDVLHGRS